MHYAETTLSFSISHPITKRKKRRKKKEEE